MSEELKASVQQRDVGGSHSGRERVTKSSSEDERETCKLRVILRDEFSLEETPERMALLTSVLTKLREIMKGWVQDVAVKRKREEGSCELYSSGSVRLGVNCRSSDIDAVCVVPNFVERETDFFGELVSILKKHSDVSEITAIAEAHVPLIRMKYLGVEVDLLLARVRTGLRNGLTDPQDVSVLTDCDEQSIRSLNVCRNNDLIISLVPNPENFKTTLKCVKVWAKRRGIYSNKAGYLGGISWAILVAKICQFFPLSPPNRLLEKFFSAFHKWKWQVPVLLCEISDPPGVCLPVRNWSPLLSENDQEHLMPIITPAYPCANTACNVSKTSKIVLKSELRRAARIAQRIKQRKAGYTWMSLFKKYDFFKDYTHYLRIDVLSQAGDHRAWEGLVESKLRLLTRELESRAEDIHKLRLCPQGLSLPHPEYRHCTSYLLGFKFRDPVERQKLPNSRQEYVVDLRGPVFNFCEKMQLHSRRFDPTQNLKVTHVTRDMLPNEVFEGGVRPHYHEPSSTASRPLLPAELILSLDAMQKSKQD